jgi:dihydrolipoamide dehydrogenase
VADALREDGIDLRSAATVVRVERPHPGGEVLVHLADGGAVRGDELLVAAGRRPATADLGLEAVGLEPGRSVPVDDTMRVLGSDWLYAVGDVNGRVLLTHQGKYQARVAADALLARLRGSPPPYVAEADTSAVPQVVFTDPEVAAVGLSSAAARALGLRVRLVEHDIGATAGGSLQAEGFRGRAALVVDEEAQVVVGATFVGQDVAEMVHAATIAVVGRVPLERLRHAVPSFPTMSEVWLRLLEELGQ